MNCHSELSNVEPRCSRPPTVNTYLLFIGECTLCISCYTQYYNLGYVVLPTRAQKPRPIYVESLRQLLETSRQAWRDYYEVYDIITGINISSLIRNLLVQYSRNLSYYDVCKIVEPVDDQLRKSDWLATDDGTQFNRVFQPRPVR